MSRYILRFCGQGKKPDADVRRIAEMPQVKVIDNTSRMLLVEGAEGEIQTMVQSLHNWVISQEVFIPAPDSHPKVQGKGLEATS